MIHVLDILAFLASPYALECLMLFMASGIPFFLLHCLYYVQHILPIYTHT